MPTRTSPSSPARKRTLSRLSPWPAAIATSAIVAACGGGNVLQSGGTTHGVVAGTQFHNARVCIDANDNGRCDAGETSATVGADGSFSLAGQGPVVAETTAGRALVLRAPAGASAVVSPLSTELAAMAEANGGDLGAARSALARRLGVTEAQLLADPARVAALQTEADQSIERIAEAVAEAGAGGDRVAALRNRLALDPIQNVVIIYAENRGFDNLYGLYPGANGIPGVNPSSSATTTEPQKDFDGSTLPALPPVWGGVTLAGQTTTITQAQTVGMPNKMFRIDDPAGFFNTRTAIGQATITRDLVHRLYNNQMQIDGGKNDKFAAYSDAGGLSMGYFDGSQMRLWKIARQYTLADNFFMGAFGGSFLNHQYLVCACAPTYPNADAPNSPAKATISKIELDANGSPRLTATPASPASVLTGAPVYVNDNTLTPKDASGMFYAVNTMQPPYQPSGNASAAGNGSRLLADPAKPTTLPPQTQATIGDLLDKKGLSWAWYAGAWNSTTATAVGDRKFPDAVPPAAQTPNFQFHHQPFNYYAEFDPVQHPAARAAHLKDFDTDFLKDAANGTLPAVSFYKPQGNLNQHNGYANITDGDAHIADLIAKLQASPQWKHMLIVVTYDENGGFYDHATVPKADRWGPGTRIPALIISPFAKKGFVDKTQYDTASTLRFITHRWSLPPLPGLLERDAALVKNGNLPMGDLTGALDFRNKS